LIAAIDDIHYIIAIDIHYIIDIIIAIAFITPLPLLPLLLILRHY
jgi:hypothetical protein